MMNLMWVLGLAACFSDRPASFGEFSCEAFSEPDDCLEQAAVEVAQTCLVPAGEVGQLDASRTVCTFTDGTVVTFDPPVPDAIDEADPLSMWIDYLEPPQTEEDEPSQRLCHVYTQGDDYPRRVGYEIDPYSLDDRDDAVDAKWYQEEASYAISVSCDPQNVSTGDPEELLTCDAFPVTPFRITNASRDGQTVRNIAVVGTFLTVSCAPPD